MSYSLAFMDYQQRFRSVATLLRAALRSQDPLFASASSKGAIVLAAAAAERFLNDVLRQACQRVRADRYDQLTDGQQAYLCAQVAHRIQLILAPSEDIGSFKLVRRDKLISTVSECAEAFRKPSTWVHLEDFGLFLDGAAAPAKINAVIRDFDPNRGSFFDSLESKKAGKSEFVRSLTELIDARHNAAHAKPSIDPSPSDAKNWIVSSFWLMRAVEVRISEVETAV